MSFFNAAEFKVGALVLAVGALIATMSLQVSDDPAFLNRTSKAWFYLPNANGLVKGSAIRSAGIPVGAIQDIRLQEGQARIDVSIKSDLILTKSATVELRANGILGDKYIEVTPGAGEDPPLENGSQIFNVKKGGSLDDVMSQVSEITGHLKVVSLQLSEAVKDNGTDKHVLGRIVQNIEKLTSNFANLTEDNKEQITEIVEQVHNITSTLDEVLNDEGETGFKQTWKKSLARIDSSLKNIDEITTKINNGDGTIGKLISDEKTAEDVSTTIEGITGLLDSANKVTTGVDFNGHYLSGVNGTKSAVGIFVQPGLDRYYYLGVITDPAGVVDRTNTVTSTNGGASTSVDTTTTYKSKVKFSALFAKNIYDFTLKGGLIENTGGVGVDYSSFNRRFTASVEAYDFEQLQIRPSLTLRSRYGLYLTAGYNDLLNKKDAASLYGGAGIFLTNDDLKLLLTRSPF